MPACLQELVDRVRSGGGQPGGSAGGSPTGGDFENLAWFGARLGHTCWPRAARRSPRSLPGLQEIASRRRDVGGRHGARSYGTRDVRRRTGG